MAVEDVAAELHAPLAGRRWLWYVAEQDGRVAGPLVVRLPDEDNPPPGHAEPVRGSIAESLARARAGGH